VTADDRNGDLDPGAEHDEDFVPVKLDALDGSFD
jgi:hypothetical protein